MGDYHSCRFRYSQDIAETDGDAVLRYPVNPPRFGAQGGQP